MTAARRTPKAPPRTSTAVYTATNATLRELKLGAEDKAGAALARRLAKAIDEESSGRTIAELGRALLATLDALGATPAARKAIVAKGGVLDDGDDGAAAKRAKLAKLRAVEAGRTGTG
ncbi:terminase small subunit [Amycolatopsis thermoflava]|uniref:terminase small subunit n=1 Tax=Amycolatopsis thermoflava TaxID=84480 RepID=UPI003F4A28E3